MALARELSASGRRDMTTCNRVLRKVDRIVVVVVFVVMIDGKLASQKAKTVPRLAGGHEADKLDLVIIPIINLITNA